MMRKLFENKAIMFDMQLQPANTLWYYDFAYEAMEECDSLINWEMWFIDNYYAEDRTIVIKHTKKENTNLVIKITADPEDEDGDIWLVYDVYIDEPLTFYGFQIP